jgi:hypothetical protein
VVEAMRGAVLVEDHAGVTEGGIEEGFTPADDAYTHHPDGPERR